MPFRSERATSRFHLRQQLANRRLQEIPEPLNFAARLKGAIPLRAYGYSRTNSAESLRN